MNSHLNELQNRLSELHATTCTSLLLLLPLDLRTNLEWVTNKKLNSKYYKFRIRKHCKAS